MVFVGNGMLSTIFRWYLDSGAGIARGADLDGPIGIATIPGRLRGELGSGRRVFC